MRPRLIMVLAALALAGCQPAAPPMATAPAPTRAALFATLAPLGSFEWQAAPIYTANAVLRHRAARLLEAGELSLATAREIQARADRVRHRLDQAVALDAAGDGAAAMGALAAARRDLAAAEQLIPEN